MKRIGRVLMAGLLGLVLAVGVQAQQGGGKKRAGRSRAPFKPMDFKAMFSAGPLSDPQPPSTLLPAGATSVELTLKSATPTVCRYSVGKDAAFEAMTPFDMKEPSSAPKSVIRGLDPDTRKVNDVYIRCAAAPGGVLHLQYRALPRVKPGFPRTANLWGSWHFNSKGMQYAAKIDLWLGANFNREQILELRQYNPNCFILTSINTVENNDVPDDYFLRDTTGKKIEVWPGAYRLNLTRPEVAEYQARYAYQKMIEAGLMIDGCFFDNFMMAQRWLTHDIYDRPVTLDADGDSKPDNKEAFDKAWRAGVFHELQTWKQMMPWALTTAHSHGYPTAEIAELFHGQGIGFHTTDVIEGKQPFHWLWDYYNAWCTVSRQPAITSVESAVPDQIAYGYDYSPQKKMPAATLDFAEHYYPYMRFGLAFTLMNDGYFSHEIGDTDHGQDWWYDELDFKLGAPLGAARRVAMGKAEPTNMIENGGFEQELNGTWGYWVSKQPGYEATVARDTSEKKTGEAAARVEIKNTGGKAGNIDFNQPHRELVKGKNYELSFWAKAVPPRAIYVTSSKGAPDWREYGLSEGVDLRGEWKEYRLSFTANETASDARIQFHCGKETGDVWFDDVKLGEPVPDVYRRDFERGTVILNGTHQRQAVPVEEGYARLVGKQAPRYQYILDDMESGFSATAEKAGWATVKLDTKEWLAIPPYYHAWKEKCHKLAGGAGEAKWELQLRGAGTYTIQAWWAAAPEAKGWTRQAVFEVVAGGKVVATKTLDQSRDGDQWHTVAEGLKLAPEEKPFVRLRNAGTGACVADALHVFSAERYNDGLPVMGKVELEPMDGIVLRKADVPVRW